MSDNEKKQMLNSLSDAIKECQLRFGGKRELATEMDGRVCFLCLKLEAIFLHGLKKTPNNLGNNQPSLLANGGAQINSMIKNNSILKSTGNLISHFFDDSKIPYAQQIKQNIESLSTQNEITFWPFVKNFMSRFDIERFELLGNIKTDLGRQRAWIRCCLNEHCLEKYTLAILANPNIIRDHYEENSFLLDKNYTTPFPMLLSGLQSILFAINLDNPNLNIAPKLANSQQSNASNNTNSSSNKSGKSVAASSSGEQTSSPIKITSGEKSTPTSTLPMSSSFNGNSLAAIETTTVKLRKKASLTSTAPIVLGNNTTATSNRRVRKNNVVVSDDEPTTTNQEEKPIKYKDEIEEVELTNGHNNGEFDFTVSEEMSNQSTSVSSSIKKQPEFSILTNPIKYNRNDESPSNSSLTDTMAAASSSSGGNKLSCVNNVRESDESLASSSEKAANEFADNNCNLIPINSSSFNLTNNSNLVDTLSMNSYQSENSNDINFGQHLRSFDQNSPPILSNEIGGGMSPSSTPTIRSGAASANEANKRQLVATDTENLSVSELREVVLTMIGRKEQCEQVNRTLRTSLNEEIAKSGGLTEKCQLLEKELANSKQVYENRIQTIENENKLLKDQLKKYVSAVQLMRPANNDAASTSQLTQPMPAINPNLQRDYSYEAEQYEKKLIQVAEMHGELMEFNSRLHSIINYKTIQIERLKSELVELRGPLPPDLALNNQMDDTSTLESVDSLSVSNLNTALISIWIPSAFLRSESKSGSHHVYQVYIRIKDEEWNIYRRFSHFYSLHSKLKEKYPIVSTLNFPKKKAIGNKDIKFVEGRRKLLQDYLRKIINLLLQVDRDLNAKPCRETLVKAIPFLSDQHFLPHNQSSNPTSVGSGVVPSGVGNIPISTSRSNLSGLNAVGSARNLSQMVRNPSNAFLNGASSPSNRPNELLYTGL